MTVQVKIRLYGRKYGEFGRFEINLDENVNKRSGFKGSDILLTDSAQFYRHCSRWNPENMVKNVMQIELPAPTAVGELVLVFLQP